MAKHARLSPSASKRWMTCPGSVALSEKAEQQFPKMNESGPHARRGTAIHALGELLLLGKTVADVTVIEGEQVDEEMRDMAREYAACMQSFGGHLFVEIKVSLQKYVPGGFGTCDTVIYDPETKTLRIYDLKTGSGVIVSPEENSQLMCYALGAYEEFQDFFEIEVIDLGIWQGGKLKTWETTPKRLLSFGKELRKAVKAIKTTPELYVLSEDGCRWCNGKVLCPAQHKMVNEAAAADFNEFKDDEGSLAKWLEMLPHLKAFTTAVESCAKESMLQGQHVPGYKVVEGRRSRKWKNEGEVIAYFRDIGVDDIYSDPKLLSIAQLEKKFKDEEVPIPPSLVEVKAGSPTIVKESDKREAMSKAASARKDFEGQN